MVTVAEAMALLRTLQVGLLVTSGLLPLTRYRWPQATTATDGSSFDVIVVGAGSAGCVIANRLSEEAMLNVLLIEAGGDPPIESVKPGIFVLIPNSTNDYNFKSENNGYTSQNMKNGVAPLTAGKMLGGSSSLHHLIHVRGNRHDYEAWVAASGDDSWSYDNLLKYFKRSEKVEDQEIMDSPSGRFHGYNGNLRLTRQLDPANIPILQAFGEIGVPTVLDVNDRDFTQGATQPLLYMADSSRQSSAEGYLRPLIKRPNFHILKNTKVIKILFDEQNNAKGVRAVTSNGNTLNLYANHEVIVSAGALVSPQLLMLSGIGRRQHLSSFNISVISDLPVGQNMDDHIQAVVVHKLQKALPNIAPPNPLLFPEPITTAYSALNHTQNYPDYQAINVIFPADNIALMQFCSAVFYYTDEICQSFFDGASGRVSLFTAHNIMKPLSRGEVLLRSQNPDDHPLVNHGIYSNKQDLDNMALYLQDFARIVNTTVFKNVNAELVEPDLPKCRGLAKNSVEYWRCYALSMSATIWHYSGTCSMGSVTDNRLRVKGVQKLRVVDASAMPNTISGNINAAVVVLAEKASDYIKEDLGVTPSN